MHKPNPIKNNSQNYGCIAYIITTDCELTAYLQFRFFQKLIQTLDHDDQIILVTNKVFIPGLEVIGKYSKMILPKAREENAFCLNLFNLAKFINDLRPIRIYFFDPQTAASIQAASLLAGLQPPSRVLVLLESPFDTFRICAPEELHGLSTKWQLAFDYATQVLCINLQILNIAQKKFKATLEKISLLQIPSAADPFYLAEKNQTDNKLDEISITVPLFDPDYALFEKLKRFFTSSLRSRENDHRILGIKTHIELVIFSTTAQQSKIFEYWIKNLNVNGKNINISTTTLLKNQSNHLEQFDIFLNRICKTTSPGPILLNCQNSILNTYLSQCFSDLGFICSDILVGQNSNDLEPSAIGFLSLKESLYHDYFRRIVKWMSLKNRPIQSVELVANSISKIEPISNLDKKFTETPSYDVSKNYRIAFVITVSAAKDLVRFAGQIRKKFPNSMLLIQMNSDAKSNSIFNALCKKWRNVFRLSQAFENKSFNTIDAFVVLDSSHDLLLSQNQIGSVVNSLSEEQVLTCAIVKDKDHVLFPFVHEFAFFDSARAFPFPLILRNSAKAEQLLKVIAKEAVANRNFLSIQSKNFKSLSLSNFDCALPLVKQSTEMPEKNLSPQKTLSPATLLEIRAQAGERAFPFLSLILENHFKGLGGPS